MTRARDLADYISTGVSDTELDVLDGVTAGTITASKAVVADSNKDVSSFRNVTLTGELDAATLDISGDADIDGTLEADGLSINGTAVTSTAAELNILDGVTATAAELNYVDIATLGTSAASKAVSADANGNIKLSEEVQAKVYLETVVALSAGSSVTLDLATGNFFTLTTNQNTTFVFNYGNIQLTTNDVHGFVLKVTAGGTHSLTWPNTVDWPGGSAPDAPASGETDVFAFISHDGGSNWYGFRAGDAVG